MFCEMGVLAKGLAIGALVVSAQHPAEPVPATFNFGYADVENFSESGVQNPVVLASGLKAAAKKELKLKGHWVVPAGKMPYYQAESCNLNISFCTPGNTVCGAD